MDLGKRKAIEEEEEIEEDYMGDLSQFLPPEPTPTQKKKTHISTTSQTLQPNKKKPKFSSWQEKRKLEKERKQLEEDEETLSKMEECPIPQSNIGFKLLKQMGYTPGSGIGPRGRAEPVGIEIRRTRVGIGKLDPVKEKRKKEEAEKERARRAEEEMVAEFGFRQKENWKGRRVAVCFRMARDVLDQLEGKEVVVVKKKKKKKGEDGEEEEEEEEVEEEEEEEEEEEVITEEDLQEILLKLRGEYRYCLFCGFQYETAEALASGCPGINEDDH